MALRFSLTSLLVAMLVANARGQDSATVQAQNAWFYNAPGGARIAQMQRGTRMTAGRFQGEWLEVTLEGWIFRPSVARAQTQGFDLEVSQSPNENLRAQPNQRILARLERGFLLRELGGSRNWVHVERVGWMKRSVLNIPAPAGTASSTAPRAGETSTPVSLSMTVGGSTLLAGPGGEMKATVDSNQVVKVLERSEGWVRVQIDGWIPAQDLEEPDVLTNITPAELREDPELYLGKTVRWRVQYIGVRTADELRPDIPLGQRYMLARGPLPAGEYLYIIIPDDQVGDVETLHPLTVLLVDGRIRTLQTRYLGNAVLDLIHFEIEAAS